jgi:hypothetical protein
MNPVTELKSANSINKVAQTLFPTRGDRGPKDPKFEHAFEMCLL